MTVLHIDFETFSACELKDRGLHNYATDPATGVHCMAFAFDDEPVDIVTCRGFRQYMDERVLNHVRTGGLVYAHNAAFELAIWNNICVPRYGWPVLKPEQVRCTMAMAYAMGLPGALENAAPALGIEQRKDMTGKRVMMQLAKPKADGSFWTYADAPEKFQQLYDYCKTDVEVERAMHHRMMELSASEQAILQLDYKINQRGIQIDLPAIETAIRLVEAEKARLDRAMLEVTGGVVGKCSEVQLLVKWIRSRGVDIGGLAKSDVLDALTSGGDSLPSDVRAALELRREGAKSSTAKLIAMKNRASADGRVRGIHQYHGAATGRWAGRGVQTQNFPRPRKHSGDDERNVEIIYEINDLIAAGDRDALDCFYGPVMDCIADGLRGMIVAPRGKHLAAVDFSAIEARVLPWLAGQEDVLDVFRSGTDIYLHAATGIYGREITKNDKAERQIGKVAVLALGYGGGVGAFQSMAKVYGVKVPDAEADAIKVAWRESHKRIVSYWYALEDAAIAALVEGGKHSAGPRGREVIFLKNGSFLWCKLPSGRVLCYPYPEIRQVETPWGDMKDALTYMTTLDSTTRKKTKTYDDPNANGSWQRISTYGGSLSENVTQAVARDLLAEALVRLDTAGYAITMHVHDEAVVEIPADSPADELDRIEHLMTELPVWAAGLPIAAESWRASRYRK